MRPSIRITVRIVGAAAAITMLILWLVLINRSAVAQQKGASIESRLVGTWMLAGMHNEKNVEVLGTHPMGMIVFDAGGRFTSQVMRSDLPKFVSSDRTKATPEESQAVIRG